MKITSDSILVRNDSLPHTEIDGALVFLSVNSGDYLRLNGIAREIWDRIASPTVMTKLVEELSIQYQTDREVIERDVMPFMIELLKTGLLTVEESAP